MFWQEPTQDPDFTVTDAVVDVMFALDCRALPVDHAHALSAAVLAAAPWLADEPAAAVHTIHVAGSQNGWERPTHGVDQQLLLSRRTKLGIRIPGHRVADLRAALEGQRLDIAGCALAIGPGKARLLSRETTLFARHVVNDPADTDEDAFLTRAAAELAAIDVKVRKALCGLTLELATPAGPMLTRSLLLADLTPEESLRLQQRGLGCHGLMGCGVFIPHKGIEPVQKSRG